MLLGMAYCVLRCAAQLCAYRAPPADANADDCGIRQREPSLTGSLPVHADRRSFGAGFVGGLPCLAGVVAGMAAMMGGAAVHADGGSLLRRLAAIHFGSLCKAWHSDPEQPSRPQTSSPENGPLWLTFKSNSTQRPERSGGPRHRPTDFLMSIFH